MRQSRKKYADGGDTDYTPQMPDDADQYPREGGLGEMAIHGATTPIRYMKGMVDAAHQATDNPFGSEEYQDAHRQVGDLTGELGMSMIGPKGVPAPKDQLGVFVGPYGAHMLRQQEREAGRPVTAHPVYASKLDENASRLRPEFQEAYRGYQADTRDEAAKYMLENGSNNPRDIFKESGWSIGPGGKPRKEIADFDAKLVPAEEQNFLSRLMGKPMAYKLEHPAGDLHEIYGIPPIRFDPNMERSEGIGSFNPMTNEIKIAGWPTKENLKSATTIALHEMQHAIQRKEGFPIGDNPMRLQAASETNHIELNKSRGLEPHNSPPRNSFDEEYFPPGSKLPEWQAEKVKDVLKRKKIDPESDKGKSLMDDMRFDLGNRISIARQMAYERSAGEVEARNVQDRRAKSYRYQKYPEDTEDISRGLQKPLTYEELMKEEGGYAAGGSVEGDGNDDVSYGGTMPKSLQPMTTQVPESWTKVPNSISPSKKPMPSSDEIDHYASGGFNPFNPEKAMSIALSRDAAGGSSGLIHGTTGGRTDNRDMTVPQGAYIVPADIVSGMGQGNTIAGGAVLGKLMNRGPYNMNIPRAMKGSRTGPRHSSKSFNSTTSFSFADGGGTGEGTPIVAAAGEYVIHPDDVRRLGGGDLDTGHDILDAFVKHMRDKTIKTLRKLPGPKGAKK